MSDHVVLVDEKNTVLGTAPKLEIHNGSTPLHRGFSVFLFNSKGKMLLQQRSAIKKTWGGVWSNSCCGHPKLNEQPEESAKRRLDFELGIRNVEIITMITNYRYRFEKDGIVENEICPIMVALSSDIPKSNKAEVADVRWMLWEDWIKETKKNPQNYSPWAIEETKLLNNLKKFQDFLQRAIK